MIRDRESAAREQLARVHPDLTVGILDAVVDAALQQDGIDAFDGLLADARRDHRAAVLGAAEGDDPEVVDVDVVSRLRARADSLLEIRAALAAPSPVAWGTVPVVRVLAQAAVGLEVLEPVYGLEMRQFQNRGPGNRDNSPLSLTTDLEAVVAFNALTAKCNAWRASRASVLESWSQEPSLGLLETATSLLVQADELREEITVTNALITCANEERETTLSALLSTATT
jgi:hypothetical protein